MSRIIRRTFRRLSPRFFYLICTPQWYGLTLNVVCRREPCPYPRHCQVGEDPGDAKCVWDTKSQLPRAAGPFRTRFDEGVCAEISQSPSKVLVSFDTKEFFSLRKSMALRVHPLTRTKPRVCNALWQIFLSSGWQIPGTTSPAK